MIEVYHAFDHLDFDQKMTEKLLQELISTPHLGRLWMIQIDQEIVGYLLLTFGFSIEFKGRDAFIDELFVKETYRNQGVGRRAIELVLEEAKVLNVKAIHLEVERKNANALHLYQDCGFVDHERGLMTYWFKT